MEIKYKQTERGRGFRNYSIEYRKDGRFSFEYYCLKFLKKNNYGWCLITEYGNHSLCLPRECLLVVESILRGLNSNG